MTVLNAAQPSGFSENVGQDIPKTRRACRFSCPQLKRLEHTTAGLIIAGRVNRSPAIDPGPTEITGFSTAKD